MNIGLKFSIFILGLFLLVFMAMGVSNLVGCGLSFSGGSECKCYGIKTNIDFLGFKNYCIGPSKNIE